MYVELNVLFRRSCYLKDLRVRCILMCQANFNWCQPFDLLLQTFGNCVLAVGLLRLVQPYRVSVVKSNCDIRMKKLFIFLTGVRENLSFDSSNFT